MLSQDVQPKKATMVEETGNLQPLTAPIEQSRLVIEQVSAYYGKFQAIRDISLTIQNKCVTAIIGPSGCGKSTLLRCINRMTEEVPGGRVTGRILLDGENILTKSAYPVHVRRRIGMVFQKPNPFPTMSILENTVAGWKLNRFFSNAGDLQNKAEQALRKAALWDEVKDKLHQPGTALSGGQQQRLCIARALAVEPEVLLMDEPCSALDPISTLAIEDLMRELAQDLTIVIVTHNMQQAARVSKWTAFLLANEKGMGELVEYGATEQLFTNPKDERTEAYITGRFS